MLLTRSELPIYLNLGGIDHGFGAYGSAGIPEARRGVGLGFAAGVAAGRTVSGWAGLSAAGGGFVPVLAGGAVWVFAFAAGDFGVGDGLA